eukprot:TRINITY_DN6284_c0_g1_i6.p1 TRINITY_DN6284_c0_g1~~TRINITY_DN6284_c0_g1_i6.p1  ORF type:complete len:414 (+),score=72.80 TRINITY_DN6284_c0_g1_i6:70-1311(+)
MKKLFGIKDKEINIARVYSQQSRSPTISSASSSSSSSKKKKGPSLKDLQKAYDDEDGWGEYATDVRDLEHEKKSPHRPGVMRRLSSLLMVANSRIKPTRAERVDNDFEFKANQRLVESANSPPLSSGHKRHSVNFGGVLGVPHHLDDGDGDEYDDGYDTQRPRMDTRIAVSLPTSPVSSKYTSPSSSSTPPPLHHTAITPDGGRHARGRRERSSTIHEYKAPTGKGDHPHESRSRDQLRRTRESRHSVSLSPQASRKSTSSSSSPQSPSSSGGAGRRSRSQSMSVAPVSTSRLPELSMEPKIDTFRKERISHSEAKGSPAKASPNRSTHESRLDSHRSPHHHHHHRESSSRRSTIHDSPEIPRGSSMTSHTSLLPSCTNRTIPKIQVKKFSHPDPGPDAALLQIATLTALSRR